MRLSNQKPTSVMSLTDVKRRAIFCKGLLVVLSHSCRGQRHLRSLWWRWVSQTDLVRGQCWLWKKKFCFSLFKHKVTDKFSFLSSKPKEKSLHYPRPTVWSSWFFCTGSVCMSVCMCVCVCMNSKFVPMSRGCGGVSVRRSYIVSWLPSTCPCVTHSFILCTTGTGRTWWILARSASTSRCTQSGWKGPLNPTNANLSAGRPDNMR